MRIGAGPVFGLEMRRLGRRWQTYAWRVGVVLALLATLAVCWSMTRSTLSVAKLSDLAALGQRLFEFLAYTKLSLALFVAPAAAADVLIPARNRGTLFHMFLTDLRNRELTLGAYLSRVVAAGQPLLAAMPVTFVIVLLGGVHPNHVVNLYLILAGVVLALPALCLALSLSLRRVVDLLAVVYVGLIVWCAAPAVGYVLAMTGNNPFADWPALDEVFRAIRERSPYRMLGEGIGAYGQTPDGTRECFHWLLGMAGFAAAAVCWTSWRVRAATVAFADRPADGARPRNRWLRWLHRRGREPNLDARPTLWLEWARHRGNLAWRLNLYWLLLGSLGIAVVTVPHLLEDANRGLAAAVFLSSLLLAVSQLLTFVEIAGQVAEDRENRHFEMLATTTLEPDRILADRAAHARGLLTFGWLLFVGVAWTLGMSRVVTGWDNPGANRPHDHAGPGHFPYAAWALAMAAAGGYGFARLTASLGVWAGLRFKSPFRGMIAGVGLLVGMNVLVFLAVIAMGPGGNKQSSMMFLMAGPWTNYLCSAIGAVDADFIYREFGWWNAVLHVAFGGVLVLLANKLDQWSVARLELLMRDRKSRVRFP